MRLWKRLGIKKGGDTESTVKIDPLMWAKYRYDYVIVLCDDAASRLWEKVGSDEAPNLLCTCTPFALWSGCEHELCVRAKRDKEYKLVVCGQPNKGGRGCTNALHFGIRGLTPAQVARRAATAEKAKAKAKALRHATSNSAGHIFNPASWRPAPGTLTAKSDVATPQSNSQNADEATTSGGAAAARRGDAPSALADVLTRAGAMAYFDILSRRNMHARALRSGHVNAEMVDRVINDFGAAADILSI